MITYPETFGNPLNSSNPQADKIYPLVILVPLLGAIAATTPFGIDTYLPAMSQIANDLSTDMSMMQLTLSVFLAGYAAGLLFFGPMADIFGRRPVVLIGLAGFAISTLMLAFTESVYMFMVWRFLQAFVGAAANVPVPGYIQMIYGKNMAKGMSYVIMIMMFAPMVAPGIGIILMELSAWPLIFIAMAAYAFTIFGLALLVLPKAPPKPREDTIFNTFFKSYAIVLREKSVRGYLIVIGLATLAFFGYLTGISLVYLEVYQVSEVMFGVLFAINGGLFIFASFINTRIVGLFGSLKVVKAALALTALGAGTLLFANLTGLNVYWTVGALTVFLPSLLLIVINIETLILMGFTEQAGTAAGAVGTLRFAVGSLSGPVLSLFYDGSAMPFCYLMVFVVVAIFAFLTLMPGNVADS